MFGRLLLPLVIDIDYSWRGVAVILLLYAARGSRASIAAVLAAFCCFWGEGSIVIRNMFGITIPGYLSFLPKSDLLMRTITRVQFYGVLALPFILWQDEHKTPMPKALGYLVYPVHILIIGIVRVCLGI